MAVRGMGFGLIGCDIGMPVYTVKDTIFEHCRDELGPGSLFARGGASSLSPPLRGVDITVLRTLGHVIK